MNQVGRALLFERLVDDPDHWFGEPTRSIPEPRRALDREGLRASVLRELRNILATRCPIRSGDALSRARTTIDYGLPDIDPREVAGTNSERYLIRLVRQAIEAYEPRLRGVDVEVIGPAVQPGRQLLRISGDLVVEQVREPLSFDLPFPPGEGGSDGRDGG